MNQVLCPAEGSPAPTWGPHWRGGRGASGCRPGWVLRVNKLRREPRRPCARRASRPTGPSGSPGVCHLQGRVRQPSSSSFKPQGSRPGSGVLGGHPRCPPGECLCHLKRYRWRQGGEHSLLMTTLAVSGQPACLMSPAWPALCVCRARSLGSRWSGAKAEAKRG